VHEKKVIGRFFDHIARDTGEFCFGINETNNALEMGAVETLIVWEDLPFLRCVMKNSASGDLKTVYLKKEQLVDEAHFKDGEEVLEIVESQNYVEWLSEKKERRRGARLELITDKSQDGSQFCVGFGGIGAILRWRIEAEKIDVPDDEDDEWGSDF
jgi:peptide chain release factor subunit 1